MLTTIAKNRPMYDVLVLLLSYPEKRQTIEADAKAPIVDEDTDEADNQPDDIDGCYNVTTRPSPHPQVRPAFPLKPLQACPKCLWTL